MSLLEFFLSAQNLPELNPLASPVGWLTRVGPWIRNRKFSLILTPKSHFIISLWKSLKSAVEYGVIADIKLRSGGQVLHPLLLALRDRGLSAGKNKEEGINHHFMTFLNCSFWSQNVSGLGVSGKLVHGSRCGSLSCLEEAIWVCILIIVSIVACLAHWLSLISVQFRGQRAEWKEREKSFG